MEQITAPSPSWLSVQALVIPVARRAVGRALTFAVLQLLTWGVLESKEAELLVDFGSILLTELIWHQIQIHIVQPFLMKARRREIATALSMPQDTSLQRYEILRKAGELPQVSATPSTQVVQIQEAENEKAEN